MMKQKFLRSALFVVALTVLAGACAPAADGSGTTSVPQDASGPSSGGGGLILPGSVATQIPDSAATADPDPEPSRRFAVGLMERSEMTIGSTVDVEGLGLVTLDAVTNDSRCGVDVVCIRAGEAYIQLTLVDEGRTVALAVPPDRPGSNTDLGPAFILQALGITPAPESEKRIAQEDYRVYLTVTARGGTVPSVSTTPQPDSTSVTGAGQAGPDVDPGDLLIREIQITGINVRILESYPFQLRVQPVGFLSGCDKLHDVTQRRDGNTITISITASSPKGAVCIAQVTDYEGDVALAGGFLSGEYTITVNGFTTNLTL